MRKVKPHERLQWLDSLDEADLVYLNAYHHVCMGIKTAWKFASAAQGIAATSVPHDQVGAIARA